ncbi:hypothetical protein [Ekhidna sp.]
MKYSIKTISIFLILIVISVIKSNAQEGYVAIANSSVVEGSLSKSELRRIYFGFTTQWKNFEKVKPAYQVLEYPNFWEAISTSESKFKSFWTKRVFSGNGVAPRDFDDSKSLIDYVNNTKGAIGIIPVSIKSSIGPECKVISIQ